MALESEKIHRGMTLKILPVPEGGLQTKLDMPVQALFQ